MGRRRLRQDPLLWIGAAMMGVALYLLGWWSEELPPEAIRLFAIAGLGVAILGAQRSAAKGYGRNPTEARPIDYLLFLTFALAGVAGSAVAMLPSLEAVKRPVLLASFVAISACLAVAAVADRPS